MIHFTTFPPRHCHTDRSYLVQWFLDDVLIICDVDINEEENLESIVAEHPCKNVLVDLSHNQMPLTEVPEHLKKYPALSSEWSDWYQPRRDNVYYFPLWFWMYSHRSNQFFHNVVFDASGKKTLPMMCLNRNPHPHRVRFYEIMEPIRDEIVYTFGTRVLPGDRVEPNGEVAVDISIGHPVYSQCAVNIVTETATDRLCVSEKSVKPIVARQIPVILGAAGINQFYTDLGMDMFEDIVPWRTWDNETDVEVKSQRIADFLIAWYRSGQVLDDYRRVQHRVEKNKQYFHSEQFRSVALKRMPVINAY